MKNTLRFILLAGASMFFVACGTPAALGSPTSAAAEIGVAPVPTTGIAPIPFK